jgi:hypothetical protein
LFRPCPGLAHPQMDLGKLLVAVTKGMRAQCGGQRW